MILTLTQFRPIRTATFGRSIAFRRASTALFVVMAGAWLFSPATVEAQLASNSTSAPTASPNRDVQPNNSRETMYRRLAEEESALTRQFSLLKHLVKTVAPSVAHIEAKKRQKSNATSSGNSSERRPVVIEEAGSGVVIEHRDHDDSWR